MSLVIRERSRIKLHTNEEDYINERQSDVIIDFIDDDHVRIKKLFPFCGYKKNPSLTSHKRFHLRCYIPNHVYTDKFNKVSKCFICFNGLDETDHFNLYDQIGKGLARSGYATILLPLPNHLNRNGLFRFNDEAKEEKPSDSFMNEKKKIYDAYVQLSEEVKTLIEHLQHKCDHNHKRECCNFFRRFFHHNVRISLLGYSLGGLAALSNFLIQDFEFNSCILLNSGAKLEDIDVSGFVHEDKWQNMVKALQEEYYFAKDVDEKYKVFDMLFLGNRPIIFKDYLKEFSNKILFILGGADNVTKYESIIKMEPDKHGLSILKLPGIHHFVSIDTHWDQWFPVVNDLMRSFDDSASKESLLPNDILASLAYFQKKYNISSRIGHIDMDCVSDQYEKDILARTIFAAKCTYGNISVAFLEMYKLINYAKKSPKLYPDFSENYQGELFCQRACKKFNIPEGQIALLLKKQLDYAKNDKEIPRIGELMLNEGLLSNEQLAQLTSQLPPTKPVA